MEPTTDWSAWHRDYDDPRSRLSERLRVVQRHLRGELDETAPRPVTVLSVCAGDGRDLLEVLAGRADAGRVSGTLLEADARNAAAASARIAELGLDGGIAVRCVDAGHSSAYRGAVPADLVLFCGVFGNICDEDVHRTITNLPQLCRPGALLVWTRHRRPPDLTPRVRSWLDEHAFEEVGFTAPDDGVFSVGAHRFTDVTQPLAPDRPFFAFNR